MVDDDWMVMSNPFGHSSQILLRAIDTGYDIRQRMLWLFMRNLAEITSSPSYLMVLLVHKTSLQRKSESIMDMSGIGRTLFTIVFPPFALPSATTKTQRLIAGPLEAMAPFAAKIVNIFSLRRAKGNLC